MWWTLAPSVMVTLAVVLIPGFAFNSACGLRPLHALGLAPLASIGLVSGAAVAAGFISLPWGPLPVVLVSVLAVLAAWGLRRLLRGRMRALYGQPEEPIPVHWGWPVAAGALAGVLMARDSLGMLGSPTNFSQTYDNVFHLNLVQWMVQNRTGSVLELTMTGTESFYPAAWHDLASLTLLTMGSHQTVAATNALIIVTVALVWPLSCLSLVSRILPRIQWVCWALECLSRHSGRSLTCSWASVFSTRISWPCACYRPRWPWQSASSISVTARDCRYCRA